MQIPQVNIGGRIPLRLFLEVDSMMIRHRPTYVYLVTITATMLYGVIRFVLKMIFT